MTTYNTALLERSNWDLCLDIKGNIAIATPPYSLAQDVASAVRTFLGEVFYNTLLGVPFWQDILGKLPPVSLLIQQINTVALTVPGVVTVQTTITSFTNRAITGQIEFTDEAGTATTVNF